MIAIKKSDIPKYLHQSQFYLNLSEDDDEINIPKFKESTEIKNMHDFNKLFKTISFFNLEISKSMYKYFKNNSLEVVKYYLINTKKYEKNRYSLELNDLFKNIIEKKIENFDQFISYSIIIKNYNIQSQKNYSEYGLKYKYKFLGEYFEIYQDKLNKVEEQDYEENFNLKNYIYLLYKELYDTSDEKMIIQKNGKEIDFTFFKEEKIERFFIFEKTNLFIFKLLIGELLNFKNSGDSYSSSDFSFSFTDRNINFEQKNYKFKIIITNFNKYEIYEQLNNLLEGSREISSHIMLKKI